VSGVVYVRRSAFVADRLVLSGAADADELFALLCQDASAEVLVASDSRAPSRLVRSPLHRNAYPTVTVRR